MSFHPFLFAHPVVSESPLFPAYDTAAIEESMAPYLANWQGRLEISGDLPSDTNDLLYLLDCQESHAHITEDDIEEAVDYAANSGHAACILIAACLRDRLNRALVSDRTKEECNLIYDYFDSEEYEDIENSTYEIESVLTFDEVSLSDAIGELHSLELEVSRIEEEVADLLCNA